MRGTQSTRWTHLPWRLRTPQHGRGRGLRAVAAIRGRGVPNPWAGSPSMETADTTTRTRTLMLGGGDDSGQRGTQSTCGIRLSRMRIEGRRGDPGQRTHVPWIVGCRGRGESRAQRTHFSWETRRGLGMMRASRNRLPWRAWARIESRGDDLGRGRGDSCDCAYRRLPKEGVWGGSHWQYCHYHLWASLVCHRAHKS
jgi:hypothetical protein